MTGKLDHVFIPGVIPYQTPRTKTNTCTCCAGKVRPIGNVFWVLFLVAFLLSQIQ